MRVVLLSGKSNNSSKAGVFNVKRYNTTYANGQIADIKIWGKELSSTEVLQIYQSEIRRYQ